MKLTIVLLLALVAVALAAPHHSKARRAFQKFKVQHGKNYVSADEESMRFRIFKANMRRVHKMNQDHRAIGGDNVFGVTQFMDLTPSEFSHMYLMPHRPLPIKQPHQIMDPSEIPTVPELPTYWDWRYNATGGVSAPGVSAVKNQGQCGSCWAFSATEQIESMNYIQKVTPKINILSEQQIVDCCTQAYGCNGGWTYVAYEYIESAGGQDSESSYPYTARNGQCQFSPSNVADDISSWKYVTQSDNVDAMMNYLASSGPLSICVDASSWQFYNGGVLKSCGQQIDHCVQLAGFSTVSGTQAWNVRNSWGTSWGESGYIYIERGSNLCAIGDVVTTVTGKAVN